MKKVILDRIEIGLNSKYIEQFKVEFIDSVEGISVPYGNHYQAKIHSNGEVNVTGGRTGALYVGFNGELTKIEGAHYTLKGDFVTGHYLLFATIAPIPFLLFFSFLYVESPEFESSFNLIVLVLSTLIYLFNVLIVFQRKLTLMKTIIASTSKYEI